MIRCGLIPERHDNRGDLPMHATVLGLTMPLSDDARQPLLDSMVMPSPGTILGLMIPCLCVVGNRPRR